MSELIVETSQVDTTSTKLYNGCMAEIIPLPQSAHPASPPEHSEALLSKPAGAAEIFGSASSWQELRSAYDAVYCPQGYAEAYLGSAGLGAARNPKAPRTLEIAALVKGKLHVLGLDAPADDERIAGFDKALQLVTAQETPLEETAAEAVFSAALERLLSAADVRRDPRSSLALRPLHHRGIVPDRESLPQPLTPPKKLLDTALQFTSGERHRDTSTLYPRIARRRVDDPDSEYWGTTVHTSVAGDDRERASVVLSIPTGMMSDEAVRQCLRTAGAANHLLAQTLGTHGLVPSRLNIYDINHGFAVPDHQLPASPTYVHKLLQHMRRADSA